MSRGRQPTIHFDLGARAPLRIAALTAAMVALLAALFAGDVHAQVDARRRAAPDEAAQQLSEGRRRYGDLDFAGAIEALRRALAVPGSTDALRLEAYEYLGASYLVLEQRNDARSAFLEMLAIDPYHALREPTGSPKIASFVAELRAGVAADAALDPDVRVAVDLPRAGRVGRALRVVVRTTGGAVITRVRLRVRGQSDETWARFDAQRDGSEFVATIPPRSASDVLEVYAEARDTSERLVARAGEPSAPLSVEIRDNPRAAASTAVYEQWWFWTVIGVVAAGAGVGIGLAATSGSDAPSGTLSPGRVELP